MFISLLKNRRSIRKYTDQAIDSDKIDILLEAALRAPSSRGFNPWEFIVIKDEKLLEKLSMAKPHGASFLKKAKLGIVICADENRSDVWVEDASIASAIIHFAAESLGLGSCWIQIRKRKYNDNKSSEAYIAEILDLPESMRVESIIAVGYPNENKRPHPKDSLNFNKLHLDQYGEPYHFIVNKGEYNG